MAGKLWRNAASPTGDDFISARDDYSAAQGLGSRVERRQDIHYPEVPGNDKFSCSDPTVAAQYPDRCAGRPQGHHGPRAGGSGSNGCCSSPGSHCS
jgi:hypothetical protein